MLFLPQSAGRPPPTGFPRRVFGRHRGRLFPENEHFSKPLKGGDMMAIFRIEKTRDYTVMSNHHLRNARLSLKSKGLLSMMLSLPEDWNYTTRGLAKICKEGTDSIGSALKELERAGYIVRNRLRDSKGKIVDVEYAHILDEDRKINAQKFESAFYANPDLRSVRPPEEPKEPAPATLDLEALVEQLRKSPELANTLATLLASAPSEK